MERIEWKYFEKKQKFLSNIRVPTQRSQSSVEPPNDDLKYLLEELELQDYFPDKLSLQTAQSKLDEHFKSESNHPGSIPWLILQKLLSSDVDFRETVFKNFVQQKLDGLSETSSQLSSTTHRGGSRTSLSSDSKESSSSFESDIENTSLSEHKNRQWNSDCGKEESVVHLQSSGEQYFKTETSIEVCQSDFSNVQSEEVCIYERLETDTSNLSRMHHSTDVSIRNSDRSGCLPTTSGESTIKHASLHKTETKLYEAEISSDFSNSFTNQPCDRHLVHGQISSNEYDFHNAHPSDVILAIFLCCDPFMKRLVVKKMHDCQFAIPFMFNKFRNNKIEISLWPIRDINILGDYKTVIKSDFPTVSFVRIGHPSLSKSHVLNKICRNQGDMHDIFFYSEYGRQAIRKVSLGMIEIFWYKVDPQKDSPLKLPCTLLNWRGGIQEETDKSKLDLLRKMSDVLVVFVSKDSLEKPETQAFLKVKGKKSIVVISDPDDKTYVQLKSPQKGTYSTISISNLEKKLSESIEKHLSGRKLHSLDNYFAKYSSPHANVDEQCEECKTGKKIAMMIIDRIPKHENGMIRKANIIPLQGEKLWMTWSKIEKESRKKGQDDFNAAEPLMHSMQTVRMEQIKACNEASEVVAMFVNALIVLSDSGDTLLYFVFWFKQELEEASRHIVQKCLRANKSHERNSDGLLSIEHFLREIGQIYEAFLSEKGKVKLKMKTEKILLKLPGVVAKLSYLGQPLEIMDGDAGNVPLLWLKEVFAEMSNITNNEKIASISVIGVQSSGKSTLLNTMFGIQYPVSAGRCTKGIFAQFIPVCRKTNKFRYVMVLDTEGLRASEKIDESINSDNEVAAFTVGLSDVSIINIKGESEADMRDILQIVVHALMRLKKTESGPEYTQSGIFVHQNVSGINIHDKTAAGNAAFMRHLDKMAEIAAQEEQIPNVNTFTSVVDLNPEIDRIYVPNLLKNDASVTASVSKGYCRSIEDTKARIFAKLKENRDVFCSAKEKYLNIRTLWKGIQAETFIFSFRNCQEAIASRILEREYKKIAWHFEEKKMGWWNKNDKKLLEAELDNVENYAEKLKEDFWEMLRMENENAKSEMDQFITNHQYVKFMEHRRQRTLENFMSLCNGLKGIIDRKINVEKAQRLEFLKQYDRMITEQSKIKEEASELADNMKNTEINEETLKEEFEKWWNKYVDERCSQYESLDIKSTNLKKEMENILRHVYGINMTIGREEASQKFPKMKNSISRCDIDEDDLRVVCESDEKSDFKQLAVNVLNLSFEKIDRYLEALVDKDARFDDFHFNILLKYVIDDVEKHNKMHYTTFAITESFTNKVICHVTQYVFPFFLSLNIDHEGMYGMRSQLSKCKLNALRIFKSQFHQIVEKRNNKERLEKSLKEVKLELDKAIDEQTRQKQEEEIKRRKKEDENKRKREKEDRAYLNIESSTDCIISQLKEYANYRFTEHLRYKIKEEVIEQFKGQKHLLMKSVLIDLANENSGNKYPSYISSPETFVLEWITNYSKRMFFEDKEDDESKYELCRGNVVIPIASSALGCLSQLRRDQNVKNMKDWLAGFRELLSGQDIIISSESLEGAEYEIEDFNLLCNVLTTKMKDLQTEMTNNQDRSIKWKGKTPYEEIMEHLWGCKENCPWCNEPCKSSIPNHADKQNCHECIQHRPVGLSGIHKSDSLKLTIESCEFKVQSNHRLKCGKWCECTLAKCEITHPYSEYKKSIPLWNIVPCADMSNSKYWTWVVGHFPHIFEKHHGMQFTGIPASWKSISAEEAVESLDAYFFEDCDKD